MMELPVMRQLIVDALAAQGPEGKAELAGNPAASIMRPGEKLPGAAQLVRFDSFPHPGASFYVGVVGRSVFYLTEAPQEFSAMVRASGMEITSPEVAIALARAYVEATRSMREFSRVVDSTDDIRWAPPRSPEEEQNLVDVTERLRALIQPPTFHGIGDGYEVRLCVLRGAALERRTLTLSRGGDVSQRVEEIASGLPTPISM
jgi:hypothetical protein